MEYLNFQDVLALLTSAIAHDVAHPGVNTAYLVTTYNELAITYNDRSPLENMHASTLFVTLRQPDRNFLDQLSKHEFCVFRSKCIACILGTDMSRHFEMVDRVTTRLEQIVEKPLVKNTKDDTARKKKSKEDRRLFMEAILHMADLGHCCRPWHIHCQLVASLEEEFYLQGD